MARKKRINTGTTKANITTEAAAAAATSKAKNRTFELRIHQAGGTWTESGRQVYK